MNKIQRLILFHHTKTIVYILASLMSKKSGLGGAGGSPGSLSAGLLKCVSIALSFFATVKLLQFAYEVIKVLDSETDGDERRQMQKQVILMVINLFVC